MNDAELLPCPFCGGMADVDEEIERVGRNRHRITIHCSQCPGEMRMEWSNASHSSLVNFHRETMQAHWNRRDSKK